MDTRQNGDNFHLNRSRGTRKSMRCSTMKNISTPGQGKFSIVHDRIHKEDHTAGTRRRRRQIGSARPKRKAADRKSDYLQTPPRISVKYVEDVESILVYGTDQDIILELTKSRASSVSQLIFHISGPAGSSYSPNLNILPQIDQQLEVTLKDANFNYTQKNYSAAANGFKAALQLCTRGVVMKTPFDADYEDVSKVSSFIESKLVASYLQMKRPDLALDHSHRSIHLNPVNFQNHLRQAVVFKQLDRFSEAARSAMIADYMYWLTGGSEQHISKLIKVYWQAMLEEAISRTETFSVMYTPCTVKLSKDRIERVKEIFSQQHPFYTSYMFTDPDVGHFLPQTTKWEKAFSQQYAIIIGFKKYEDGCFLEKLLTRKCPTFAGKGSPFSPITLKEAENAMETLRKKILPVLDFIKCTKLTVGFGAGSGIIEKLQYASYLSQLQDIKEQSLVINQVLGELVCTPYLQDISQEDAQQRVGKWMDGWILVNFLTFIIVFIFCCYLISLESDLIHFMYV
uniref:Spermatosis associated 16 n=1 Tax=Erpetoichthys calabaricus TaxID=27687 RepID=A0A8C4XB03_ERPCA